MKKVFKFKKKKQGNAKRISSVKRIVAVSMAVMMVGMLFMGCSNKLADPVPNEKEDITATNQPTKEITEDITEQATVEPIEESTEQTIDQPMKVAALKGPTAMGMVKLMNDEAQNEESAYDFRIVGAVDEITPLLVKGEVDLAAVPANLASVLYNNTNGAIQVVAVNTLGVIYIVETGDSIQSISDLKGKTIYASGKGATPEFAINYLLESNGIDPNKDVTIEYKSEHTECVAVLAGSENAIAMLPQPFVTTAQMKNEKIRIALDLTKEWDLLQEGNSQKSAMITGVIVARKEFVESQKEQLDTFLDQYKSSVEYVTSNQEDAASMIGAFDIVSAEVAKKALPYCNITFIEGEDMQEKLSGYLEVLFEANPKSIGGALPDDKFYYNR